MNAGASWPRGLFASLAVPDGKNEVTPAASPPGGTAFQKVLARAAEPVGAAKDDTEDAPKKDGAHDASAAVASAMQAIGAAQAPLAPPVSDAANRDAARTDAVANARPSPPSTPFEAVADHASIALVDRFAGRALVDPRAEHPPSDPLPDPADVSPLADRAASAPATVDALAAAAPLARTPADAIRSAPSSNEPRPPASAPASPTKILRDAATPPAPPLDASSDAPRAVPLAVPATTPTPSTAKGSAPLSTAVASAAPAPTETGAAASATSMATNEAPTVRADVLAPLAQAATALGTSSGALTPATAMPARPALAAIDAARAPVAKRVAEGRASTVHGAPSGRDDDADARPDVTAMATTPAAAGARPDVRAVLGATVDAFAGGDKPLTHVNAPSPEASLDAATIDARGQLHAAVVSAMNHITMRREASGHIELPDLGRIEVSARPNGAEIDVRITAALPETAQALHRQMPQIEADLRAGEIPLHQVTVGGDGGSRGFDRPSTSSQQGHTSGEGAESGADEAPIALRGRRVRIVL